MEKLQTMTRTEIIEQAAKRYIEMRKTCGVDSIITLDEVNAAFCAGALWVIEHAEMRLTRHSTNVGVNDKILTTLDNQIDNELKKYNYET